MTRLILVRHGDAVECILAHCLGLTLELPRRIAVPPASASTLDLAAQGARRALALTVLARGA